MTSDVEAFVEEAVLASAFVEPDDHGLTHNELVELGRKHGIGAGAIGDYLQRPGRGLEWDHGRYKYTENLFLPLFIIRTDEPDYRNVAAFAFVAKALASLANEVGKGAAKIERDALVARGEAEGLKALDVRVAILFMGLGGQLNLGPTISARQLDANYDPRDQLKDTRRSGHPPRERKYLRKLRSDVEDLISRRSDGRPMTTDPLRAFGERLQSLGHHPNFKTWWMQVVGELDRASTEQQSLAACVLAATLVEGALTLVVSEARKRGDTMTKGLPEEPKQWKLKALSDAAKTGARPIFTQGLGERCSRLNLDRQRIHAGTFFSSTANDYPRYDARPEDAAASKETARSAVRAILDWIDSKPKE